MTQTPTAQTINQTAEKPTVPTSSLWLAGRPILKALLGAACIIGITAILDYYQCRVFQSMVLIQRLETSSIIVREGLNEQWAALRSLSAFVAADPSVDRASAQAYTKTLHEIWPSVGSLQLIREGTLFLSDGPASDGTEASPELNLDKFASKDIGLGSEEISVSLLGQKRTDTSVVVGNLPVIRTDTEVGDNQDLDLWGHAVVSFSLNDLLKDAERISVEAPVLLNWQVIKPNGLISSSSFDGALSADQASNYIDLPLGNFLLRLTATPGQDWSPNWPGRAIWWLGGLALAPAVGALILILFSQPRRLKQAAEQAIRAQEDAELRFRAICDNSPTEVYLKDTQSRLVLANRQMMTDYGQHGDELIGKTPLDLFPPESAHEHLAHDHAVMLSGEAIANEYQTPFPGGMRTQLSLRFPIRNQKGEITTIGAIDTDITDRKATEEALIFAKTEAERAALAKSRFVASASHDLRQPLAALKLMIYDLAQVQKASDQESILHTMNASANAMTDLIENFLDLTKLEIGGVTRELQDFKIGDLLGRVAVEFEPLAKQKGLDLRVLPCGQTIQSDFDLLGRIIKNFVANAIRYTHKGRILLGCRRQGLDLEIQVWDTGLGIEPEEQDKIFDEFYQISNKNPDQSGTLGLGLSIANHCAKLLDSRIVLRSSPGQGSVFCVRVPLGDPEANQPDPIELALAAGQQSFDGVRMLLIDDDEHIRISLARLLERWGASVTAVGEFGQAVLSLGRELELPDVIIADYNLSENHTGKDFISTARAQFDPHVPAILVTGDMDVLRSADPTRDGFPTLPKPVEPAKLRALLHHLLRSKRITTDAHG
ncbi:MAG: ATP-binding protein [Pseudomonadota bacterium]